MLLQRNQKKLADKYAEIFSVLLKHKKDIPALHSGAYMMSLVDRGSPLLFDRSYQPRRLSLRW